MTVLTTGRIKEREGGRIEARELYLDRPVEYLGDDEELDGQTLFHGHPGRVETPAPEDVFIRWVGLEEHAYSRWIAFDLEGLGALAESEYLNRADRVIRGERPA